MAACEFIANHITEGQKQRTFEQVNRKLSVIRAASEKEQELYSRERGTLKKRIADLRATITHQQGSGTQREEVTEPFWNLEKEIRELTEVLATERRVPENSAESAADIQRTQSISGRK
jgi:hypothetical protein